MQVGSRASQLVKVEVEEEVVVVVVVEGKVREVGGRCRRRCWLTASAHHGYELGLFPSVRLR
jgi:hypothetical protein